MRRSEGSAAGSAAVRQRAAKRLLHKKFQSKLSTNNPFKNKKRIDFSKVPNYSKYGRYERALTDYSMEGASQERQIASERRKLNQRTSGIEGRRRSREIREEWGPPTKFSDRHVDTRNVFREDPSRTPFDTYRAKRKARRRVRRK